MSLTKPSSLFSFGWIAGVVVRFLRSPQGGRSAARPEPAGATSPAERSVPLPLLALTRLLDHHPTARTRMKHLALIETSCRMSPDDPLRHVPPRSLDIAIRQLEPVLDHHPGLHVLRLQLERQLQNHRTRVDAALAHEHRRWRPDADVGRFDLVAVDGTGHPAFAETLPLSPRTGL